MSAGYYTIAVPTKPYLKKYLQSLYGKPMIFDRDNYFGTSLVGYLERKFFTRQSETISYRHFDEFTAALIISMPSWWIIRTHFATDIPTGNVIYINKHFEERFEEDLVKFCLVLQLGGVEVKQALETFCAMHEIELDVDMTFEAIKQKHYRARKKFKNLYCKSVTPKMKVIRPEYALEAIQMHTAPEPLSFRA